MKLGYHPATFGRGLDGLWAGMEAISVCGWDGFEYAGDLLLLVGHRSGGTG